MAHIAGFGEALPPNVGASRPRQAWRLGRRQRCQAEKQPVACPADETQFAADQVDVDIGDRIAGAREAQPAAIGEGRQS